MRQALLWGLAWLVFTVSTAPSTLAAAEIPPTLVADWYETGYSVPRWVSLEAAFDNEGRLLDEHFAEWSLPKLETSAVTPDVPKDCLQLEEFYESNVSPPDRDTLRRAAHHSEGIAVATVQASAVGFQDGVAGTLYSAEITERIRGFEELANVFFFVPVAQFQVGGRTYCKIDRRWAEPPAEGDEVLLMVPRMKNPSQPFVDLSSAESLVVFPQEGEVGLPRAFDEEGSRLGAPATRSGILRTLGGRE